jgi:hypothetical protein
MEVIVTDEFLAWYQDPDLDEQVHDAARAIIVLLEQEGVTLKVPTRARSTAVSTAAASCESRPGGARLGSPTTSTPTVTP